MDKAEGAFLTIGELARELGVAQHILRYWETRFTQLRPLQRSGNRRYYRPADVTIARRIDQLLNRQGFTVRGAQRVLEGGDSGETWGEHEVAASPPYGVIPPLEPAAPPVAERPAQPRLSQDDTPPPARADSALESSDVALLIARLTVIRENLKDAIGAN